MMDTDTQNTPPEVSPISEGQPIPATFEGLHEAAREISRELPPIEKVPAAPDVPDRIGLDGENQGIKAKDAAESLAKWREQQAAERAAFEKAVNPEAEPEDAPAEDLSSNADEVARARKALAALEERNAKEEQADPSESLREVQAARQSAAGTLGALQQLILSDFHARFPDIRSEADLERLSQEDPLRLAEFEEYRDNATKGLQAYAQHADQHQAAWAQHHEHFGKQQVAAFAKAHPELSDPKIKGEIAQATLTELRGAGFTDQDIAKAWHGVAGLPLRHAAVQALLLDAVRYRIAQKNVREGRGRKPVPPVQRPGSATDRVTANEGALREAEAAMAKSPNVRNAARLMAARRAGG